MYDQLAPVPDERDDGSAWTVGEGILVETQGVYYPGTVAAVGRRSVNRVAVATYKIHYDGWSPKWRVAASVVC